jgi:hypothetical protein
VVSKQQNEGGGNMPFIGGRYYANALAGHAIEAARAAEAAAQALKTKAAQKRNGSAGDAGYADSSTSSGEGEYENASGDSAEAHDAPIHRVEIEAAELVPSHSGRAQHGFVARVHRDPGMNRDASNTSAGPRLPQPGQMPWRGYAPKPETHVFASHNDLLDFLKTELGKECAK